MSDTLLRPVTNGAGPATGASATDAPPLLLLRAGREDASLPPGFEALLIEPFGRTLRRTPRLDERRERPLAVVLPWRHHAEGSPLLASEPELFDAPEPARDVVDPRRSGPTGRRLLIERDGAAEMLGEWLATTLRGLRQDGVRAVLLPGIDALGARGWAEVLRRSAKTGVLVYGETQAPQRYDGAGFAALVGSASRTDLSGLTTPLLGDLLHQDAELDRALLESVITHDGFVLSAAQARRIGTQALGDAARLSAELRRSGPARITRLGPLAVARLPNGGEDAAAFGRDHSSIVRLLNGRYTSLSSKKTQSSGVVVKARARSGNKPAAKTSADTGASRLQELAPERIAIEDVYPLIDGGRFPAKRIVGDVLEVGADIFCDGHEKLAADLILTEPGQDPVRIPMEPAGNDRWRARATLQEMGLARFDIEAWRDLFASWRSEVTKKREAGQNVRLETIEGSRIALPQLKTIAAGNSEPAAMAKRMAKAIEGADEGSEDQLRLLLHDGLKALLRTHGELHQAVRLAKPAEIRVDREKARFSSWYELFPRSMSGSKDEHGTFRDVIERLPYIQDLGFDVLYFPPIHPIGSTNRKGRNNTLTPEEGDVGSPYAIGSEEGGHDALHPELGSFEDFEALVKAAAEHGMEIALDFAIQCSPDHPWLKEHKEWFDWRPDGTIKFAENPPKKYEDIVNVHFYRKAIPDLWYALRDVVLFWCEKGVRIFRVDNPHTKPYPFWEWMIEEVKNSFPDALFLSEAFTRPKVMRRLAKLGFTQSYTYYTWRNSKDELTEYVRELTETGLREVMNPNFFVNTPDINPPVLQTNNRDAYIARTWLAGTLASSYGIYNGIEIAEGTPLPGKEEYLDSEKYEIRVWDMDREGHIKDEIRLLNRLRQEHPALRNHVTTRFLTAHNDRVLWYAKATPDMLDVVLFAVSLDFENDQRAAVEVPLWFFGLPDDTSVEAYDVIADQHFSWAGKMQEVLLGPGRIVRAFVLKPPQGFEPADDVLYADKEAFR